MTKQERVLVVFTVALIAAFITALMTGAAHWLNQHQWWGDGGNLIQWAGGIATFAGLGMLAWWYWSRRCGQPRCIRLGEHPVAGTHKKVCRHHHRLENHHLVHALHRVEGALGWGESHR